MKYLTHYTFFYFIICFLSKFYNILEHYLRISKLRNLISHKYFYPMNIIKPALLVAMFTVVGLGCKENSGTLSNPNNEISEQQGTQLPKSDYERYRNGKIKFASKKEDVFNKSSLDSIQFPVIKDQIVQALEHQLKVLRLRKQKKNQRLVNVDVSIQHLEQTIELLLDRSFNQPEDLKYFLDAYQTWGKDKKGNVKFTGYYTPEINVKKNPDATYKYPIYAFPKDWEGKLPTRAEIDGEGALQNLGLEIAYASSPVDIYYVQLQGSGFAKFVDTKEKILLRFAGGNGHSYNSIEQFMLDREDMRPRSISVDGVKKYLNNNPEWRDTVLFSNPSYAFFKFARPVVKGSGGVPLMEGISVAADPKYFPMGSVLLAEVPVYDRKNNISHHEFKLLFVQDVGGAIRGPGRIDIYSGVGERGRVSAGALHHYGRMWLLLPKQTEQIALKQ